jgi:hypothetical protein
MFINLYIQFMAGPHAGEMMTLMCIGVSGFLFQMSEVARVPSVYVVGFEVLAVVPERSAAEWKH